VASLLSERERENHACTGAGGHLAAAHVRQPSAISSASAVDAGDVELDALHALDRDNAGRHAARYVEQLAALGAKFADSEDQRAEESDRSGMTDAAVSRCVVVSENGTPGANPSSRPRGFMACLRRGKRPTLVLLDPFCEVFLRAPEIRSAEGVFAAERA
jgi:hypothetical protein